jgi:hypothetical protein
MCVFAALPFFIFWREALHMDLRKLLACIGLWIWEGLPGGKRSRQREGVR